MTLNQLVSRTWTLAKDFDRPEAYDTAYLVGAEIEECIFWTADRKLYRFVLLTPIISPLSILTR
jgi:predicted nucleic acid-binding protein